jgi:ornithine carbamoyltransferase
MQLGRDETIADTARVLSRYVDIIMIRTKEHDRLMELADAATVPVINALTDDTHPCQIMADVMTYEEHRGPIEGHRIAWTGDGNNVLHSLIEASPQFGFDLSVAVPEGNEPGQRYVDWARSRGGKVGDRP